MIGRLSGRLAYRGTDHAMIDVGGVGYLVTCSERTLAALPPQGGAVTLWTDLLVREDLLQLMGFATLAEKEWYRLLTTVQGVGARAALAILGTLGPDGVGRAIALGDAVAIRAAPGVGPKLAQRVAHELRDKAPSVMAMAVEPVPGEGIAAAALPGAPAGGGDPVTAAPPPGAAGARADAMSALANLGYAPSEAAAAVAEAEAADPAAGPAALIRAALRLLAPKE